MKRKLSALSQKYVRALKKHLKQGLRASLQPALKLGRQALALGLELPELTRIHEQALATLDLSKGGKNRLNQRSRIFLIEASKPMEKNHRATLKSNLGLNLANRKLDRRTVGLASTNESLKQNIVRRKTVERALRKRGGHFQKLLSESHHLQKHLQQLAHQVLSAQEDRRKVISHKLQDGIAQTLLGINVRLLSLKKEAAVNAKDFKKDIASTQLLVEESVQSINRFAHELNPHQPA